MHNQLGGGKLDGSEHVRDFNSELIRFTANSAKQKSLDKIVKAACALCATLPGYERCSVYRFDKRSKDLRLMTHAFYKSKQDISLIERMTVSLNNLDLLKKGTPVITDTEMSFPLHGGRGLYGIIHTGKGNAASFTSGAEAIRHVSTILSRYIADAETISALKVKLAVRERSIAEKSIAVEKKTLLAAEANHRVRNNLQIIHSMLINRIDEFKIYGDEAEITIRKIAGRIMAMAQVYDQLLVSGDKDVIQGDIYLNALLDDLIRIYGAQYPNIRVVRDIHSVTIKLSQASVLGIVLIELVTNAFIHAFPTLIGHITVSLKKDTNRRCATLIVKDDGKGFSQDVESKRNGVRLAERLIEHIGGQLTILNDAGTTFLLSFKP